MEWVANLHTKEHTNKQGYSGLRTSSWNCQYNTPNLFDFANMLVNGITILHNFESILLKKKKDVEDLWGCACLAIWANVFSFSFAFYYLYTRKKVQHKCFHAILNNMFYFQQCWRLDAYIAVTQLVWQKHWRYNFQVGLVCIRQKPKNLGQFSFL